MRWIPVTEGLPEINEPLIGYDDDNIKGVLIENFEATVLAYDPNVGIFKAKINKGLKWSEVSSGSINGCVSPTHWMPLPPTPDESPSLSSAEEAIGLLEWVTKKQFNYNIFNRMWYNEIDHHLTSEGLYNLYQQSK